jgi:hypothetical protein
VEDILEVKINQNKIIFIICRYMPKEYPELRVAGTIFIEVPQKVLKFGKDGKLSLMTTLTKTGTIGKHNNIPNIKLFSVEGNTSRIRDQGQLLKATKEEREKQGKKKGEEVASYEKDAAAKVKALNLSQDYNAKLEAEMNRLIQKAWMAKEKTKQREELYEDIGKLSVQPVGIKEDLPKEYYIKLGKQIFFKEQQLKRVGKKASVVRGIGNQKKVLPKTSSDVKDFKTILNSMIPPALGSIPKRPRGRPPGSKNKPK